MHTDSRDVLGLVCRGPGHELSQSSQAGPPDEGAFAKEIRSQDKLWREENAMKQGMFADYLDASIRKNVNIKAANHLG